MFKNNKPYILIATLFDPCTTSSHYIRNFRRLLGTENVVTCGPKRYFISWDMKKGDNNEFGHDVELPEKQHPHVYTYTEIFDMVRSSGYSTDFDYILIFEPNVSAIVGPDNFRPSCHISYAQVDDHRGPRTALKYMTLGKVDSYIHPNEYYSEIFKYSHIIDGIRYDQGNKKFIVSKTAHDDLIHKVYQDCEDFEKYDIIFVGNTGIDIYAGQPHEQFQISSKWAKYIWKDTRGNVMKEEGLHPVFNHGCPQDHRFFEYAERAELLCRLRKDYPNNFKILEPTPHPIEYAKLLNKGKIVINMSIAQDLNMRVGEALGTERVLIADECEGMDSVCGINNVTYVKYRKFYNPLNVNWDLTYDIIKAKIQYFLADRNRIKEMQNNVREWKKNSKNTYLDRVKMIIKSTIGWEE